MWFRSKKDFPKEVILLEKFQKEFEGLLSQTCYIAKSMYQNLLKDYQEVFVFFETLERSYLLEKYIIKNHLNKRTFQQYMYIVKNTEQIIRNHNDQYITLKLQQEKDYLDTILSQIDSHISLDEEQRRVVLNEEDYCLVIAGAGAGKTTTLAAKVKYLVEKKHVLPSEILVVSFTNRFIIGASVSTLPTNAVDVATPWFPALSVAMILMSYEVYACKPTKVYSPVVLCRTL